MAIQRVRQCTNCKKEFSTTQYAAKFCSDICRTKSATAKRNNKKVSSRISKIPASGFWLWIAKNCKRSGSVEILKDVDLVELHSLYERHKRCYGYDPQSKKSKFHICHIAPAKGVSSIGLLHHANLFIGDAYANQKHSNKHYHGAGLSLSVSSLKPKWLVKSTHTDKQILELVVKYLGVKLVEYATHNPIKKTARLALATTVFNYDGNATPLAELEKLSVAELRALQAKMKDQPINTYDYSKYVTTKRSVVVYKEELDRLASISTNSASVEGYQFVSNACILLAQVYADTIYCNGLSSIAAVYTREFLRYSPLKLNNYSDLTTLRNFISFTAFETLSGKPVNKALISNTLKRYLSFDDNRVYGLWSNSKFSWIVREHEEFKANLISVEEAIIETGLYDPFSELLLESPLPKRLNNAPSTPAIEYALYH